MVDILKWASDAGAKKRQPTDSEILSGFGSSKARDRLVNGLFDNQYTTALELQQASQSLIPFIFEELTEISISTGIVPHIVKGWDGASWVNITGTIDVYYIKTDIIKDATTIASIVDIEILPSQYLDVFNDYDYVAFYDNSGSNEIGSLVGTRLDSRIYDTGSQYLFITAGSLPKKTELGEASYTFCFIKDSANFPSNFSAPTIKFKYTLAGGVV